MPAVLTLQSLDSRPRASHIQLSDDGFDLDTMQGLFGYLSSRIDTLTVLAKDESLSKTAEKQDSGRADCTNFVLSGNLSLELLLTCRSAGGPVWRSGDAHAALCNRFGEYRPARLSYHELQSDWYLDRGRC